MSTPEEYFLGVKLDVAQFRIFGSSIYSHVTKDARKNVELTTELGIFMGYTYTPHKYRVYFLSHKMIMVCRDVNFDEENAMRCSLERVLQLYGYEELLA